MRLLVLLLVLLSVAAPAAAADRGPDAAAIWNLQWENDIFSGGGTDRHYTNGLRLSTLRSDSAAPGWLRRCCRAVPWFPGGGRVRPAWSLGQNIYTPEDITTDRLVPDDRPYAGWLYLGAGLVVENGRVLDLIEFSAGVVGPSALGEQMQRGIHRVIDSPDPQGWEHQLHDELALQATWQRKWRRLHEGGTGLGVDVLPHVGAALGNVFVYGAGGATVRLGWDLAGGYGPPRIQPSLPGSEFFLPRRALSGYLFLGGEARVTLRDIFLDGNTFGTSHSVEKRVLVGDLQGGLAVVWRGIRGAYTYVVRTREFTTQAGHDAFGAFTLSIRM